MMMHWGGFDPNRRSLRHKEGGKLSCPWVLSLVRINFLWQFGGTPPQSKHAPKMVFKSNMWDTHHHVNERWPLLEEAYELQIWKLKIFACIFPKFVHVCMFQLRVYIHPTIKTLKKKIFTNYPNLITSTLQLLNLLKCC